MSALASIGVRVESVPSPAGLGGGVIAIAYQIASLLERLTAHGEASAIDLRSLPMSPVDRERLQAFLGTGEVEASIEAEGRSVVRETAIAGVWWIEHRDLHGELLAELIEVCRIPEILVLAPEQLAEGACALRERIAAARVA